MKPLTEQEKALKFVRHIENHIRENFPRGSKVMCKICNKTIDEIAKEPQMRERRDIR